MDIPWILVSVAGLIIILGVFFALSKKKVKKPTDYYALFRMGVIWLVVGIPIAVTSNNYGLMSLGIIFIITGLANKGKWEENRRDWRQMDPAERKITLIVLGIGTVILLMIATAVVLRSR